MEDRRAKEIASKRMLFFIAVGLGLILSLIGSFWVDRPTTINLPLSGHVIAIDAGHGGPDGGAVSKSGIIEKDITLKSGTSSSRLFTGKWSASCYDTGNGSGFG